MRKSVIAAVLSLAIPIVASAGAPLKSNDLFTANDRFLTLDGNTGLEWLDVSLTKGLSVDQVLANTGGWLDLGFRYATFGDLSALFADAGLTNDSDQPFGSIQYVEEFVSDKGIGLPLASMLGPTRVDIVNSSPDLGVKGFTAPFACTASSFCDTSPLWTYYVDLTGRDPTTLPDAGPYDAIVSVASGQLPSFATAAGSAGSWLVRNQAASVPEPGTLGLFALGILALLLTRRRSRA